MGVDRSVSCCAFFLHSLQEDLGATWGEKIPRQVVASAHVLVGRSLTALSLAGCIAERSVGGGEGLEGRLDDMSFFQSPISTLLILALHNASQYTNLQNLVLCSSQYP